MIEHKGENGAYEDDGVLREPSLCQVCEHGLYVFWFQLAHPYLSKCRKDVDLEENVIHVVKARKKTALGYAIGTVKTQGSLRVLAMPDRLSEAMRCHRNNASGEGLVFPSRDGGIQHPGTVQGRLEKLCKLAGIDPPVVPYELRHTAASMLSDAGVPIEELADFMGHTTTAMLEQVYRHRVRKVIDVAKVFNPS